MDNEDSYNIFASNTNTPHHKSGKILNSNEGLQSASPLKKTSEINLRNTTQIKTDFKSTDRYTETATPDSFVQIVQSVINVNLAPNRQITNIPKETHQSVIETPVSYLSNNENETLAGMRSDDPLSRIVQGVPAAIHEFPWLVILQYDNGYAVDCAGTLISSRYVLTAAHCVRR